MKITKSALCALAILLVVASSPIAQVPATAGAFDQPQMQSARTDLQKARAKLNAATADKGGHRNNALTAVNNAIAEINAGMRFDRRRRDESAGVLGVAFASVGDQPRMKEALELLRSARSHLNNATADKGGHRAKAIEHVNKAIDEVEKGIEYDRTH
ncbi:MAG: hypothetical protein H7Z38_22905 [Rubrivivax sp.]|nr:hypothetical protein [Pyrinomonadaceae bacterium]